ncbi:hypothetical protein FRB94_009163 [Tulasnella sp. JGI-2019a]|nr:hypothetical protein FRB94_009163 [Tulasnella sp. JGI-2019a]
MGTITKTTVLLIASPIADAQEEEKALVAPHGGGSTSSCIAARTPQPLPVKTVAEGASPPVRSLFVVCVPVTPLRMFYCVMSF